MDENAAIDIEWGALLLVGIPMVVGWLLWLQKSMSAIKRETSDIMADTKELLVMHKNPGTTGFGTEELVDQTRDLRGVLEQISRGMREVSHYLQIANQNETGKRPQPPMPGSGKGTG